MTTPLDWNTDETVTVHATLLGERIDPRALVGERPLGLSPVVLRVGERGVAAILRYGVVVTMGVSDTERRDFVDSLHDSIREPLATPVHDDLELRIDPEGQERVTSEAVMLRDLTLERLLVVADVLAKSVVLDYLETSIATAFDRIEPLAINLERKGRGGRNVRELLGHIGRALLVQQKTVWRVEIGEKPDVLWEHPELERLHERLQDEYELAERHAALDRKLTLIHQTAQTLLDLVWNRRGLRVEWYIVLLILFDIVYSLLEGYG